jgi:hypothetical protein
MATTAEAFPEAPGLWRQAWEDLQPFPRRAAMTWRIALLCAIVVAFCMMHEIPEAAISCYLVIYLTKPDAIVNVGTGAGFFLGLFGVVALLVWIVNLVIGSTMHIMAAIVVTSFLLLYLGAASQLGENGGVGALVIAFLLTLIVKAPEADLATFALREAWAMAAAPMALMVVFNLLLGFSPVTLLRDKLRDRLSAAALALEHGDRARLRALLREGNAAFDQQALAARLLRLVPRAPARQLAADVRAGFALTLAVSALPAGLDPARRAALASAIRAAEAALAAGEAPPPPTPPEDADPAERAAWRALGILAGAPEGEVVPAPKIPFLAPDALTNPAYSRFAIKTTLAAVICFLTYTAIDWQGIHTAMITCYVAALGTTGETVHKLALRIMGCRVGAALGLGAILFVIPAYRRRGLADGADLRRLPGRGLGLDGARAHLLRRRPSRARLPVDRRAGLRAQPQLRHRPGADLRHPARQPGGLPDLHPGLAGPGGGGRARPARRRAERSRHARAARARTPGRGGRRGRGGGGAGGPGGGAAAAATLRAPGAPPGSRGRGGAPRRHGRDRGAEPRDLAQRRRARPHRRPARPPRRAVPPPRDGDRRARSRGPRPRPVRPQPRPPPGSRRMIRPHHQPGGAPCLAPLPQAGRDPASARPGAGAASRRRGALAALLALSLAACAPNA